MSVRLKPYPEYKDSGLPWLGKVPVHWKILRAKYIFREINERSTTGAETHLSMSQRYGLIDSSKIEDWRLQSESYIGGKICKQNDLVLNRLKAHLGVFAHAPQSGVVSPDYTVFRPMRADETRFFELVFKTPIYVTELRRSTKGIVEGFWRLYTDDFYDIRVPVPPQPEQCIILFWINQFDLRFRRLIRAKLRLIELLNEQKQIIIHRAVTRGLNPNVRLKNSGIDWLGDVPEHWEITALRIRYSVQLGKMLDTKRITGSYLVPYLRNTDVQWDRINSTNLPMMDIPEHEHKRYLVQPGDLLVCEGGDVGRSAFWDGAFPICGYQKALHRLRPISDRHECPRFLFYVMFAASKGGIFIADGSENTIAHLTAEKLRHYRFAFPPKAEQEAIARHLDRTLSKLEQAMQRANREIDLLREYRTRLIADVVTGKLDARGVELPMLDKTEAVEDWEADEDAEADEMEEMEGVEA